MSIDFNMIKSEVENLARELNRYRDNELSHKDKIVVSDLLAETVRMIRKKYGITTMYYLISEMKAAEASGRMIFTNTGKANGLTTAKTADG